ncbi:oxidoreductase, partial [Heyndrickxia oleronia]
GSELKRYGQLGTIRLSNDNNLFFGKENEELKQVLDQTDEKIPTQVSKEARAYYPAFYPFIEKVYEYITLNTLDEDLPTIKDGHENQTVLDRILFK